MSKTSYLLTSLTACAVSMMVACGAPQQDQDSTDQADMAPVTMTEDEAIPEATPQAMETPEVSFTPEVTPVTPEVTPVDEWETETDVILTTETEPISEPAADFVAPQAGE